MVKIFKGRLITLSLCLLVLFLLRKEERLIGTSAVLYQSVLYEDKEAHGPLKIYVYEPLQRGCGALPILPQHEWRWDSLEAYLFLAFSNYSGRVMDPEKADFFFVPHASTMVYHGTGYNQSKAACHVQQVIHSVNQHPYAARSAWVDHVIPWAHDNFWNNLGDASTEVLPWAFRNNAIFIVNQGDDGYNPGARAGLTMRDFDIQTAIVVLPPSWKTLHVFPRPSWKERKYLAVFRGSLLSDPDYSNNVRQTLMEQFLKDPQPDIVYGNHNSSYAEEMRQEGKKEVLYFY